MRIISKKRGLTIIGMSIRGSTCQTRGEGVHSIERKKPPKGYMWSGRRMTKIQATTRPVHVWPEVWTRIGNAAQNREKQELAKEKLELDNTRKMKEFDARNCILEEFQNSVWLYGGCHQSTRQRAESLQFKNHEDHMAGKGFTSINENSRCKQGMETIILEVVNLFWMVCGKSCHGQGMVTIPAWYFGEVRSKRRLFWKTKRQKDTPHCHIHGYLASQECGVRTQNSEVQGSSRVPGENGKDDSVSCALFSEQGSSVSQMIAANK